MNNGSSILGDQNGNGYFTGDLSTHVVIIYFFYLLHIYYRERIQNKVKKTGDKTGFFTRLIYIQIKKEMVKV